MAAGAGGSENVGRAVFQHPQGLFIIAVRRVLMLVGDVDQVLVGDVPLVDQQARLPRRGQDLGTVGILPVKLVDRHAAVFELLGRHAADQLAQRQRAAGDSRIGHHQHPPGLLGEHLLADQAPGEHHRSPRQRRQRDPADSQGDRLLRALGRAGLGRHQVLLPRLARRGRQG